MTNSALLPQSFQLGTLHVVSGSSFPLQLPRQAQRAIERNATTVFQAEWARLSTADDFAELIWRFGVNEFEALCMAGESWAAPITVAAFLQRLQLLADIELPCNLLLGPADNKRSYRVLVDRMRCRQGRLHLVGDAMTFVLPMACVGSVWTVTRPSIDGAHLSLELFDQQREPLLRLCADQDRQTAAVWRDIIGTLPLLADHP